MPDTHTKIHPCIHMRKSSVFVFGGFNVSGFTHSSLRAFSFDDSLSGQFFLGEGQDVNILSWMSRKGIIKDVKQLILLEHLSHLFRVVTVRWAIFSVPPKIHDRIRIPWGNYGSLLRNF